MLRSRLHVPSLVRSLVGAGCLLLQAFSQSAEVRLTIDYAGLLSWTSESLTTNAPFLHYEFQVETSPDLRAWTNFGGRVPGGIQGSRSSRHDTPITKTNALAFYRLAYRLNLPGGDLRGRDFSGQDLRNANLAGANLSGVNFSGADLSGAVITGAQLAGANLNGADLDGVSLDGLDLSNIDLSSVLGSVRLSRLNADPAGDAATLLLDLPYNAEPGHLSVRDRNMPGMAVSVRNAMVMLKKGVTVGKLNEFLQREGAVIVGSTPKDALVENGTLMIQFPTQSALELYQVIERVNNDPVVEAAAPDILIGEDVITDDSNPALSGGRIWKWGLPINPGGGNWGLETAKVPQMWNLNDAISKRGGLKVPTCVIDSFFTSHPDLNLIRIIGDAPLRASDHGMHVAGIIGATFNNQQGIDGINPFAELTGFTTSTAPSDYPYIELNDSWHQANAYAFIRNARAALQQVGGVKVINMSLGYKWTYTHPSAAPITNVTTAEMTKIEFIALQYAAMFAPVALSGGSALIVCTAGNDSKLIPARLNSPMATAGLALGVPNIIVVESLDEGGGTSPFSNVGGNVAAPGGNILSTGASVLYTNKSGTSMAAPFVAGLAGYLWALDPTLTPSQVRAVIENAATARNVDAFASVMGIDIVRENKEILRMLLDIDDGTTDGNRRIAVTTNLLARDRSFEVISGPDYLVDDFDGDGGPGDGKIDMADFRRWRDWLLFGESNHALDGSSGHAKKDGNGDQLISPNETTQYPRGDFNGDGGLNQTNATIVPGALSTVGNLKDLDVLIRSGLWQDDSYRVQDLTNLIDSADFTVSARNFFEKNGQAPAEGLLAVYDADTHSPIKEFLFTRSIVNETNPAAVLTVPVGKKYYIASDYIPLGAETNVIMRSIRDFEVSSTNRGADWVVDLSMIEMTAAAELRNPNEKRVDSRPDEEIVDAHFGPASPEITDSIGVSAWADEDGTFYTLCRSGEIEGFSPTNSEVATEYSAYVRWQRSFIKDPSSPFLYDVKPMILRLFGGGPQGEEQTAYAEIFVEMRAYDLGPAWQPVFYWQTGIAGTSGIGQPSFRIEREEGTGLQKKALKPLGNFGAEYIQNRYPGRLPLGGIQTSNTFEVRYTLFSRVVAWNGNEGPCEAYIGDPLHYGSGVRMAYGGFGELPYIANFSVDGSGANHASFHSRTNFYYILYRDRNDTNPGLVIDVKLGSTGLDELVDRTPVVGATVDSYTIENQPLDKPLDLDGDSIDDVYELRRASILHPLDASDALEDPDGDGRPNLREYLDGTDPAVADAAPGAPAGLYPAQLIETDLGASAIGDVNNDGLIDLVALYGDPVTFATSLDTSLAQPDGSFLHIRSAPIPDAGEGTPVLGKLNNDAFLDAVMVNSSDNVLQVMLGDGRGFFTAGPQYELGTNQPGRNAERVLLGDLNNDTILDAVAVNRRGRLLSILLGNGDGTFDPPTTLSVSFDPTDAAIARLDGDAFPELLVTLSANQLLVFPGTGGGAFGQAKTNTTASSPQRIISGDINRDGNIDVIVSHQTSDGIAVFLGNGDATLQPKVDYPTGDNPRGMALADLDADNDPDLIVAHIGSPHHAILLNNGNGVFTTQTPAHTTADGSVFLADFTRDGRLDLLSSADGGTVFLSTGLPGAKFDTRTHFPLRPMSITTYDLGDLNGDNVVDFVIGNGNTRTNEIEIVLNQGGTNLVSAGTFVIHRQIETIRLAHLDEGNALDITVISGREDFFQGSTNELQVLLGNGAGGFSALAPIALTERPIDLFPGDVNGDGRADLVLVFIGTETNQFHQSASVFLNQGSGLFAPGANLNLAGYASHFALQDLNADGRADLIAAVSDGNKSTARIYLADASGAFAQAQEIVPPNFGSVGSFTLHDFSGDGRADLVAMIQGNNVPTRLVYFIGNANGTFGSETFLFEGSFAEIQIIDLNGDGRADVHTAGTIWLARNTGGFEAPQEYWLRSPLPIRISDIDRDGKPDLIAPDDQTDSIQVLFHR